MSYYDGEYGIGSKIYPRSQPSWLLPCTCREEYEEKREVDPNCNRCNKTKERRG